MPLTDILKSVKFVINPQGKKSPVLVDIDFWERIVTLLEDIEDAEEIKQARTIREDTIPWETVKKNLILGNKSVQDRTSPFSL